MSLPTRRISATEERYHYYKWLEEEIKKKEEEDAKRALEKAKVVDVKSEEVRKETSTK